MSVDAEKVGIESEGEDLWPGWWRGESRGLEGGLEA